MAHHLDRHDIRPHVPSHEFAATDRSGERRTWIVVAITTVMMGVEIAIGAWSGSLALLADGWHMATHAVALGLTGLAYLLARRYATDPRFAFGTWKIEVLGGFASALVLGLVAVSMVAQAIWRLWQPHAIAFGPALAVAILGLAVNLVCAVVLAGPGPSTQHHGAHHHHHHHHHDINLRAAHLHVLADALTSLLAIGALVCARATGWNRIDPAVAVVGAVMIGRWALRLARDSARVLLDGEMSHPLVPRIRAALENDDDSRVCDLHVWRVARDRFACIASVVATAPATSQQYKARLSRFPELAHVTVEVIRCEHHDQICVAGQPTELSS